MSIAIDSVNIPAVQAPSSVAYPSVAYAAAASAVLTNSYKVPDAINTNLSGPLNGNAARVDLITALGGANAYCVGNGLAISAPGSGLLLNIAAGLALIGGIVEVPAATTYTVPDATARVWVWLKQNGTFTHTTTTTPPAGANCLLGSCVTSGGNITSVDTSGVLFIRGGALYRESSDAGMPADTPPATVQFVHKTAHGRYWWDGAAYLPLGIPQVGADPASPRNGDLWMRTDTFVLKIRVGGVTKSSAAFT